MFLSDISVKRPVLATVLNFLLVAFGVLSFNQLPVRELPDIDRPVVSIDTTYRGASAFVVDQRITQLLEDRISGIEGIEAINSTSQDGRSDIAIEFSVNRDIDEAANDVRAALSRALDNLPEEADPPETAKANTGGGTTIWFNLFSDELDELELTDYADRYIVDRLSVLEGVARVRIGGSQRYAMRIWLSRVELAARGLTSEDVERALRAENVELPAGSIESVDRQFTVRVARSYSTAEDFRELVIFEAEDGYLIRLGDVARVEIGPDEWRREFRGNTQPQVGLGIIRQSTANELEVARLAKAEVDRIRETLPESIQIANSFDRSMFVAAAIDEVYITLSIAMGVVILVIYIFLGSVRAAIIPAVTVPVCLIATFSVLAAMGLSVNLLTLLALVLSIGLVVDDSIVVLENVQRRIDAGEPPLVAAFRGTRQVGFAVIATTAVLVSVFIPIMFLQDDIGRLFFELAVAVSAAVIFSSFVALTLSAMLTSKLLRPASGSTLVARITLRFFAWLNTAYISSLKGILYRPIIVMLTLGTSVLAIYWLANQLDREAVPMEDRAFMLVFVSGPEGQSFEATRGALRKVESILMEYQGEPGEGEISRVLMRAPRSFGSSASFNDGFGIIILHPWQYRDRHGLELVAEVNRRFAEIPEARVRAFMPQGIRSGDSVAVQFVIGGPDYQQLAEWRDIVLAKASENPGLIQVDSDLTETKPQLKIRIDRTRAADLGVSVAAIGRTLETMLGGRRVTTYLDRGEEYDVILQGEESEQNTPNDMTNIFVRSDRSGELIPLSNLITVDETADPTSLNRYNRVRAVTIEAGLAPGYSLGEALAFLEDIVRTELPATASIDYKGESKEYREAAGSFIFTLALAGLIVFLVLAAQFESFIHPFVILLSVPLAIAGGLYGLFMIDSTLNIYSQIGIVILVALAAKNGILIVEFANQMRDAGMAIEKAVLTAAETRFRPILMTGMSTAFGAMPLVLASGAGEASRQTIGIVIFAGVGFATLLTLFVIPVFYMATARFTTPPGKIARELEVWELKERDGTAPERIV